jgi:hypothetical protein
MEIDNLVEIEAAMKAMWNTGKLTPTEFYVRNAWRVVTKRRGRTFVYRVSFVKRFMSQGNRNARGGE